MSDFIVCFVFVYGYFYLSLSSDVCLFVCPHAYVVCLVYITSFREGKISHSFRRMFILFCQR